MVSIKLALAGLMSATLAVAHMELTWPAALRSKYNPNTPFEQIDYTMNSPLVAAGTYPCKGFIASANDASMKPVTTWSAGGTYNYTVAGTATHGGGSCQLAMSYDNGKSWQVIFSYIGGCMVEGLTTEFTLPADAPSGEALFSWNWFNQIGNREMYQNCAVITVTNGGAGLSPSVYPTPFVANAGVNTCSTVPNQDPVFPEPGPNVRYGGAYANGGATPGNAITGTNCYGPGESGGGTPAGSNPGSGSGLTPSSAAASSAAATGRPSASASAWSEPSASSAWSEPSASSAAWGEPSASSSAWSDPSASSAWSEPASSSVSRIGYEHAAQPTAESSSTAAAAAPTSSAKSCRRRKRAIPLMHGHGHVAARHERFIPRRMYEQAERQTSGRVAALKAEHIVRA